MESRFLTLDGRRARVWTGGTGPALLLLHGGIGDAAQHWQAVWHTLAQHHRVIAPDLPGMGESDALPDLTWETMLSWLDQVLDAHDAQVVDCVGNSFGGALARLYAANRPARVRHTILVNGGMLPVVPSFAKRLMRTSWLWAPLDWLSRKFLYSRFGLGMMVHRKDVLDAAFVGGARQHAKGFSAVMVALFTSDLPRLTVPRRAPQLIWGAEDRTANRKVAEQIARETTAAAPALLADCGHMPQLESPDVFVRALHNALAVKGDERVLSS